MGFWHLLAPSIEGHQRHGLHFSPSTARQIWFFYLPALQENPEDWGWIKLSVSFRTIKLCKLWLCQHTHSGTIHKIQMDQTCSVKLWKWSDMQYRRPPSTFGEEGKLKWTTRVASVMARRGMQSSVKAGERNAHKVPWTPVSGPGSHTTPHFCTAFHLVIWGAKHWTRASC